MDFKRVYAQLETFFQDAGQPFAVIGGLALHAYGLPRATYDLDLIAPSSTRRPLVAFLESLGYETLHASDFYSNHLHRDETRGRVDAVYVGEETGPRIFAGARPREILPGLTAPIPEAEHLIALKAHAMRQDPDRAFQEMSDIRGLLRHPSVDRERVRRQFRRRGMLETYERLAEDL